ncbi:hypothetical protein CYR75_02780 [Paracoccus jeotgali]|uniref:SCP domain-containing protein n=2 Tax=Paracoccus jeotgali TaxID=2065379 RepID=A0A2K9MCN5_9RHOB|nr:hypothetical protein CYR75_02780 [Paracoccus jeotgali]
MLGHVRDLRAAAGQGKSGWQAAPQVARAARGGTLRLRRAFRFIRDLNIFPANRRVSMPRPASFLSWALAPALMLGLAGCELPSAAGDSEQPFTTPATANPNLPAPATEELAPLCPAPDPAQLAVLEQQINAERTRLGRSALTFRPELAVAAQAHACDMARMGRLGVAGSNGSSVVDRIRAVNYSACSSAQLIGQQGGATGQMAQWLAHKPDQEILVHNKFDDAGIGMVASGGRYWWSLVMADRCS